MLNRCKNAQSRLMQIRFAHKIRDGERIFHPSAGRFQKIMVLLQPCSIESVRSPYLRLRFSVKIQKMLNIYKAVGIPIKHFAYKFALIIYKVKMELLIVHGPLCASYDLRSYFGKLFFIEFHCGIKYFSPAVSQTYKLHIILRIISIFAGGFLSYIALQTYF